MNYLLYLVLFVSNILALTQNDVKQNCCTLYGGYSSGTELKLGSRNLSLYLDGDGNRHKSQMTESQALSSSGYCDSEIHHIYAWEDPQPIEGLPSWANPQYKKYAYSYTCLNCDKSESDFPSTKDGFDKQSIVSSFSECQNLILNFSDGNSGTIYEIDSTNCPNLIGCYYNIPSSNSGIDGNDNSNTDNPNSDGNENNTTQSKDYTQQLNEIKSEITDFHNSFKNNNDLSGIKDVLNGIKNYENNESDESKKIDEFNEESKTIIEEATTALNNIKGGYESIKTSYNDLMSFLQDKKGQAGAATDLNLAAVPLDKKTYTIFGREQRFDCFFNQDLYSLFAPLRPFITFMINIYFIVLSIRLFMKYTLRNTVGVV